MKGFKIPTTYLSLYIELIIIYDTEITINRLDNITLSQTL